MQISKYSYKDSKYPELLREITHPPKSLYVCGELPVGDYVAVVGSRTPTKYGEEATYKIAYDLAKAGLVIVSGLAYGVDAIAHKAALDAGAKTVAVLGGGIDTAIPAGNRALARLIVRNGAVVSEYELGTPGNTYHFPARNRIIAGLSLATIVTEANASSGSLITANFAINNNRVVLAIPGNITNPRSAGPNNMIRSGEATAITSAYDVLDILEVGDKTKMKTIKAESREEAALIELMTQGINNAEDLIEKSELSASQFATIISLMEITGKVKNLGAGYWSLRH